MKLKNDFTQQNRKISLCEEGNETVNHIISECGKIA